MALSSGLLGSFAVQWDGLLALDIVRCPALGCVTGNLVLLSWVHRLHRCPSVVQNLLLVGYVFCSATFSIRDIWGCVCVEDKALATLES